MEKPPSTEATPSMTPSDWSVGAPSVLAHLDPGVANARRVKAAVNIGSLSRPASYAASATQDPSWSSTCRSAIEAIDEVVRHDDDRVALAVELGRRARAPRARSCESRAPVGSSASRSAGRLASARAIATRCRWPPESAAGGPSPSPGCRPSRGAPARAGAAPSRRRRRRASAARRCAATEAFGSRLYCWKTKPIFSLRIRASAGPESRSTRSPSSAVGARRRRVEAAEDRHERRLARSRGPDQGEELAPLDRQVDPAQGVDGHAVGAEGLLIRPASR